MLFALFLFLWLALARLLENRSWHNRNMKTAQHFLVVARNYRHIHL